MVFDFNKILKRPVEIRLSGCKKTVTANDNARSALNGFRNRVAQSVRNILFFRNIFLLILISSV
jgi:hypothetical protein